MSNFTTREVAETLGTDAKTLRKFLRAIGYDNRSDEGRARYAFTQRDVTALSKKYETYKAELAAKAEQETEKPARKPRAKKPASTPKAVAEVTEDEELSDDIDAIAEDLDDL